MQNTIIVLFSLKYANLIFPSYHWEYFKEEYTCQCLLKIQNTFRKIFKQLLYIVIASFILDNYYVTKTPC